MKTVCIILSLFLLPCLWAQPGPQRQHDPGNPPPPDRSFQRVEREGRMLERMRMRDPEEAKRLGSLREQDPEAFRQVMREKVRGKLKQRDGDPRRSRSEHLQEILPYLRAVRTAQTPEDRERATRELQNRLGEQVDRRLEERARHIERLRTELAELEQRHQQDIGNRDRMVENMTTRLLEAAPREHRGPEPPRP